MGEDATAQRSRSRLSGRTSRRRSRALDRSIAPGGLDGIEADAHRPAYRGVHYYWTELIGGQYWLGIGRRSMGPVDDGAMAPTT